MNYGRPYFLDSNLFVYAFDAAEPLKMARAQEVINHVAQRRDGFISTQVLNETFSNLIKPHKAAMGREEAADVIDNIIANHDVAPVSLDLVRDAISVSTRHQLSYYDSLIVVAARTYGAGYLLTEDLQAEQVIEGVRILHVLDADFDLSRLD